MKLAAAARQLKTALSTTALLSRTGQLDVDCESDSSGARFVTRASVSTYWLDRTNAAATSGPSPSTTSPDFNRWAELARRDSPD